MFGTTAITPVTTESFLSTATQPAPSLPTELVPPAMDEKPKIVQDMASMFLANLKNDFKPKQAEEPVQVEVTPVQPTQGGFEPFTSANAAPQKNA